MQMKLLNPGAVCSLEQDKYSRNPMCTATVVLRKPFCYPGTDALPLKAPEEIQEPGYQTLRTRPGPVVLRLLVQSC